MSTSPIPSRPTHHRRRSSIAEIASAVFQKHRRNSSKDITIVPEKVIELETLSMNPEDYDMGVSVGQGASATVYLATYKPTNKPVCIKVIDLDRYETNQIDALRREIQIWSLSKHQHLLPVYGSFVSGHRLNIVAPFLSGGSILDIMKYAFQDGFEEVAIATILKQVLLGLDYLHKNNLIHRDVKAGNCLIDEEGVVSLADFGVSSSLGLDAGNGEDKRNTFVGTPCWMAPEVMEQKGYDYKADIWSFGITAMELAIGHAPRAMFPPLKVLMLTIASAPPRLENEETKHSYSRYFKDMIRACLQKDPSKRPTAEKLLQHPFFRFAKPPAYLAENVFLGLPPVDKRSHNLNSMIPLNQKTTQSRLSGRLSGYEWDFPSAGPGLDAMSPRCSTSQVRIRSQYGKHLHVPQHV